LPQDTKQPLQGQDIMLAEEHKKDLIFVRFPNYYRACNFHCPYCIADLESDAIRYKWPYRENHANILKNLLKLDYRFNIRLGPAGEFFLSKELINDARKLTHEDKVEGVNLITNLSLPLAKYEAHLDGFDLSKVAIVASLHPTEIENHDDWIEKAQILQETVELAVVLVAYPPLLYLLPKLHKKLTEKKIPVAVNGFIGSFGGNRYPEAYTNIEKELLRNISFSRHEYEYWIEARKPGLCNAGHKSIYIDIKNGQTYSCGAANKHYLGNLLTGTSLTLLNRPMPCENQRCLCDSENLNPVVFENYYQRKGIGLRGYQYKYEEESQHNDNISEWNIAYW